jgi:predicted DNA-binding protein with PD1-like motif
VVTKETEIKSTRIYDDPITYAVVFDKGEEFLTGLEQFAREKNLAASHFTAIGAFSDVTTGYFDPHQKTYLRNQVDAQVEVLSLVGDIALDGSEPKVHAHVVVGKANGTAHGGHILEAHVWPTLEVIITTSPAHLRRKHDPETGLALIDPEAQRA